MAAEPYFFVSYIREDADVVHPVVEALWARGIRTWQDTMLIPGENWADTITQSLHRAMGLIVFVSQASTRSEWVTREVTAAAGRPHSFVIPVILEHVQQLPAEIRSRQWIDASAYSGQEQVRVIVEELVRAITYYASAGMSATAPPLNDKDIIEIAYSSAAQARGASDSGEETPKRPDSVFIVHGHDLVLRDDVEQYIRSLGVKSVVLTKISNTQQSLLQKFLTWSRDVRFAVVLISADDRGASRRQYDEPTVKERALQFRARQNVVLELGFFYGYLGWEHVFVLFKPPDEIFPNFEIPSDLAGVPFDEVDPAGRWRTTLAMRLRKAGFAIAEGIG